MLRRGLAVLGGFMLGSTLYFALTFGVVAPLQRASGDSPEEWLGVAFFVAMPLALLAGSALTGYIARSLPNPRWIYALLHAPGLYLFLVSLPPVLGTIPEAQLFFLEAGVVWIITSTLGVVLGSRGR